MKPVQAKMRQLTDLHVYATRDVEWDKGDVWFAHCCMLDEAETKQFADNHIGIAHCPSSNMRLASGGSAVDLQATYIASDSVL